MATRTHESIDQGSSDGGPADPIRRDYRPGGTYDKPTTFGVLRRTLTEFSEDQLTDQAAALTYYGLLALFPALIALVSIIGLFADPQSTSKTITDIVTQIGPSSAASTFSGPIQSITSNQSTAGIMFVVGLVAALWSASGYVGAFMRAANVIYETPEGRPIWKLGPLQMLVPSSSFSWSRSWRWRWYSPGRSWTPWPGRSGSAPRRRRSGTSRSGR